MFLPCFSPCLLHFTLFQICFTSFHFVSLPSKLFYVISLRFTSFQICFISFHFILNLFHFTSLVCIHFKFASLQDFISLSLHFPSSHLFLLSFTSFHVIKFASLHFTLFYFISNLFHFVAFHFSLPFVLLYWATSKLSVYVRAIQPYIYYQFATPFQSMVPVAVTWRFVASKITAGRAHRTSRHCGRETSGIDA